MFEISYKNTSLIDKDFILNLIGCVYSDDGKFLSNIIQLPNIDHRLNPGPGGSSGGGSTLFATPISQELDIQSQQIKYKYQLMFTLDQKALDHIENRRNYNPKKDVEFYIFLRMEILKTFIHIADNNFLILGTKEMAHTNPHVNILVTSSERKINNSTRLFQTEIYQEKIPFKISSSDWVSDFQSNLGIGKFLVVEVPDLRDQYNKSSNTNIEEQEFKRKLDKSYEILEIMNQKLREGRWNDVIEEARKIWELFYKGNSTFLKNMMITTTSLDENTFNNFQIGISHFFQYFSNLHHSMDKGNIKTKIFSGDKEDAYAAYMISSSYINILTNKFSRISSH